MQLVFRGCRWDLQVLQEEADSMNDLDMALQAAEQAVLTDKQKSLVVKPEGYNLHFKYPYYADVQIASWYRLRFAERGILFVPDVVGYEVRQGSTNKGGNTWLTTVQYRFTIMDGVTGATVTGGAVGQGDDPGDKGANKAFTGAVKFFLMKLALIGGEAESEADELADRRADERSTGKRAPYADERQDDEVEIGDSDIKGIQRGGRAAMATEAQIKKARLLARDLNATPVKIMLWLEDLGLPFGDLPEDPAERGPAMITHLEGLTSVQIGELLADMKVRVDRLAVPDVPDGDGGSFRD
jgi:hypothetical protein